jgi:biopolymer transport protein ExbD
MASPFRKADLGLGVNLGLIITPMLDMAFQLMAFFIMTFQPMSEEKNIVGILLPAQGDEQVKQQAPGKGPAQPKDKLPQPADHKPGGDAVLGQDNPIPKDVVRVILEPAGSAHAADAARSSEPGALKVKFPEDAAPRQLSADKDFAAGLKKLAKELDGWPGKANGKLQIEVPPDLRYAYFIQVQDVCRAAKYREIGFPKPVRPKKG